MDSFFLLVAKDLRVEWHNRRRLQSLLLFGAVLAAVIGSSYRAQPDLSVALPTLIWMLTVFLQLLFLGQIYQSEIENSCFDGLRISPMPKWRVLLAKTAAGSLLVSAADLIALGLLALLTGSLQPLAPGLLLLLAFETVGLISVGNLLFGCTAAGEEPAIDLYALALLLAAPLILFGPDATRRLFEGAAADQLVRYFLFLAAYAATLVFTSAIAYHDFVQTATGKNAP